MGAPPTARVPGLEARLVRHDDDTVPWFAVRSQRNADGSESHVWER